MRCISAHGFVLVAAITASAAGIRVRRINGAVSSVSGSLQQSQAVNTAKAVVAEMANTKAEKEAEHEEDKGGGTGKGGEKGPGSGVPFSVNNGDRLFIARIPSDSTQDEVAALFSSFGQLTNVFLANGDYSAFCFISYTDATAAKLALSSGPHQLRGHELVVEMATPRQPQVHPALLPWEFLPVPHWQPRPPQGHPALLPWSFLPVPHWQQGDAFTQLPQPQPWAGLKPGRLFLSKVGADVTKEDLQGYFQQWGQLQDVYIPTGKSFAFVSFSDANAILQIVGMPEHEIKPGCFIHVDLAYDQPLPAQAQPWRGLLPGPGRLFLRKVGADVTKEDLRGYFQQWGEVHDVQVPLGKSIAFVSFRNAFVASQILTMPEHEVKPGCVVRVNLAYDTVKFRLRRSI